MFFATRMSARRSGSLRSSFKLIIASATASLLTSCGRLRVSVLDRQFGNRTAHLDSWKAIAAHLRRTVRTVQRWERHCGLPVHRHFHRTGSSVYAVCEELDAWWEARGESVDDKEHS